MKFIVASKKFFGQKKSETLRQFLDENNQLTLKDKQELVPGLEKELGVTIEDVSCQSP